MGLILALVAGGGYGYSLLHAPAPPAPPQQEAAPASLPAPATQASRPPVGPSFDIVRVSPDGGLVMAGTAAPGAQVTVRSGGTMVGQTEADGRGAWVMVPDGKLAPGASQLTLSSRDGAGDAVAADAPVLVTVPNRPAQPGGTLPALAVLEPPGGASRLLQAPGAHSTGHALALATVDYDEHGAIRFSGSAPPDAPVRVYVDNAPVGDAKAGDDGHWTMSPANPVAPGLHRLRVDQLDPRGKVASRVAMPFQRETLALAQVSPGQVLVEPGQNLWRLARQAYGTGIRYTVIFLANKDQIRNANLIYPGQVFTVPVSAAPR